MQDAVNSLKQAPGQALDYLKANPTIAAMLLAGGGAGLAGGYLTSQQPEDEAESNSSRRMRIIRNALLSAGAGAGAVGLGAIGYKRLSEAVPAGTMSPAEEKLKNPLVRAVGSGVNGLLFAPKGVEASKYIARTLGKKPNLLAGGGIGLATGAATGFFAPEIIQGLKEVLIGE